MNRTCECGQEMTFRCIRQRTVIGGITVTDGSAMGWSCAACGETEMPIEGVRLAELKAVALIIRDGTHVTESNSGAILKFARKAMGMIQAELAGALGLTVGTVSRWESGEAAAQRVTQLAVLALLDQAIAGPVTSEDAPRIVVERAA